MRMRDQKFDELNPAMGLVGNESFIYIVRFSSESRIDTRDFCEQAQDILYDDIGSSGHFRIAPIHRKDLNENFILGGRSENPPEFMPRNNHELFVAFIVRGDDPDNPLSKEFSIIPKELDEFCQQTGLAFEQLDVRDLYRTH